MALVELRRAREVAQCQKETGDHTKHDDPDPFKDCVPKVPNINDALLLEKIDIARYRRCRHSGRNRQRRN